MSKYGLFSGPYSVQMRENEDQKTPYLDTFQAMKNNNEYAEGIWIP